MGEDGMLKKVIAAAYKSKGKKEMSKSELIQTLSFDLKYFTHETSKKIVEFAEKNGLISGGEKVKPLFNVDSVDVLPNFKPDVKKLFFSSLFEELVSKVSEKTGKNYNEVVAMINERQEKFKNLLSAEVVALIVAKEVGVDISGYIKRVEREIFGIEEKQFEL